MTRNGKRQRPARYAQRSSRLFGVRYRRSDIGYERGAL